MHRPTTNSMASKARRACYPRLDETASASSPPPSRSRCSSRPRRAPAQQRAEPAPLATLVAEVDIPYETFTLPNGLTTIVHTDRKSPVVGVTIYYRVGSKHEPRGRTGFAHLFEHLMFGGSENVENFDIPLEARRLDRHQRLDLVRPHQLRRDRADRRARPGAVHGKRPHGPPARRGHPGQAR